MNQINLNQIDWTKVAMGTVIIALLLILFNCGGQVSEKAKYAEIEAKIAYKKSNQYKAEAIVLMDKTKEQTKKIDSLKLALAKSKGQVVYVEIKAKETLKKVKTLEDFKRIYSEKYAYNNIPVQNNGLVIDTVLNRKILSDILFKDVALAKLKISQESLGIAENVILNQDSKIVNLEQGNDKLLLSLDQMTISSDKNAEALKSVEKSLKRTNRAKNTFAITTMVFGVLAGALIIAN